MRGEDYTYLWYKDKYLERSQSLCWFSKVIVVSPSRLMTSLALGRWLVPVPGMGSFLLNMTYEDKKTLKKHDKQPVMILCLFWLNI